VNSQSLVIMMQTFASQNNNSDNRLNRCLEDDILESNQYKVI